jgi:hypothetical protein
LLADKGLIHSALMKSSSRILTDSFVDLKDYLKPLKKPKNMGILSTVFGFIQKDKKRLH